MKFWHGNEKIFVNTENNLRILWNNILKYSDKRNLPLITHFTFKLAMCTKGKTVSGYSKSRLFGLPYISLEEIFENFFLLVDDLCTELMVKGNCLEHLKKMCEFPPPYKDPNGFIPLSHILILLAIFWQ